MKKVYLSFGLCFFILFVFATYKTTNPSYISRKEPALGTFVTITIENTPGCKVLLDRAFQKIREIEKIFNIYAPDSEISCLNRLKKMEVSNQLLYLIQKSIQISEITKGAFDITVLPLIEIYRKCEKENVPPSENQVKEAMQYVGWGKIQIKGNTVTIPGGLDMGGIAKGYAVDRTVGFLKEKGVENGLINAGGDIYCIGKSPSGRKWRIGIQDPFHKTGILKTLYLTDTAVATSGDYERYISIKGKKYGHIINPVTGKTVQDFPTQVTVIAENTTIADGLATAFFVLGAEKSIEISDGMDNVAVMIIDSNGKTYQSRNFSRFMLP